MDDKDISTGTSVGESSGDRTGDISGIRDATTGLLDRTVTDATTGLITPGSDEMGTPISVVQDLIKNISKIVQGLRLYDRDNDLLKKMREQLELSFKKLKSHNHEVIVKVDEDVISYQDEVIFSQRDRDSIASKMTRDGVRSIVFTPDATYEELLDLLSIFEVLESRWRHEHDLVDRLWMLNLNGIKYSAVDGFDQLIDMTDGRVLDGAGKGLSLLTGNAVLDEDLWGGDWDKPLDIDDLEEMIEEVESTAPPPPDVFWTLHNETAAPVFERMHTVGRFLASVRTPPMEEDELQDTLKAVIREQLALDDRGMERRIRYSLEAPGPVGARWRRAWRGGATAEFFVAVLQHNKDRPERYTELVELASKLCQASASDLAKAVAHAEDGLAVRPFFDLIHSQADDPPNVWYPVAAELSPSVIEVILGSIPLKHLNTPSGEKLLERLFKSDVPAIFAATCRSCPAEMLPEHKDRLLLKLNSTETDEVVAASDALRRLNDPRTGIFVLNAIRTEDRLFVEDDRRSLLRTTLALGGNRYMTYLEQCIGPLATGKGGWLGMKQAIKAHRNHLGLELTLEALARYGSRRSWDIIRRVYGRAEPELQEYIRELRADWEDQPMGDPETYQEVEDTRPTELPPARPLWEDELFDVTRILDNLGPDAVVDPFYHPMDSRMEDGTSTGTSYSLTMERPAGADASTGAATSEISKGFELTIEAPDGEAQNSAGYELTIDGPGGLFAEAPEPSKKKKLGFELTIEGPAAGNMEHLETDPDSVDIDMDDSMDGSIDVDDDGAQEDPVDKTRVDDLLANYLGGEGKDQQAGADPSPQEGDASLDLPTLEAEDHSEGIDISVEESVASDEPNSMDRLLAGYVDSTTSETDEDDEGDGTIATDAVPLRPLRSRGPAAERAVEAKPGATPRVVEAKPGNSAPPAEATPAASSQTNGEPESLDDEPEETTGDRSVDDLLAAYVVAEPTDGQPGQEKVATANLDEAQEPEEAEDKTVIDDLLAGYLTSEVEEA